MDVSTLGKILVQGADAAVFLERALAAPIHSLKPGRARYWVALRDDGMASDDGTVVCLAPGEYLLTATTAHAAATLSHLERLAQTAWPSLSLHLTDITDRWAAIAVAGPESRALLQSALQPALSQAALSNEALPHMGCLSFRYNGAPARIHRMSFSGERAYEVYTAPEHAPALWNALLAGSPASLASPASPASPEEDPATSGIAPYGLEASDILRQEKGHISGPELDGRTTLADLGLARLGDPARKGGIAPVGAALARRPALADPDRPRLIALRPEAAGRAIPSGALLFPLEGPLEGHGAGWVSSSCWSPAFARAHALGFLARGAERIGEKVRCWSPIDNALLTAEVCDPHALYDPKGERMRG